MESRHQGAVPDFFALESGFNVTRAEDSPLGEAATASDSNRSSVKDHFYDDAQVLQDIQREQMLKQSRANLQITKTLSFTDFDDPNQLELVDDVQDDLCANFGQQQQDRNHSSDDTITESRLEEQSHFSLSVHDDIDVFLSPTEFRKVDEITDGLYRRSPLSSPRSSNPMVNDNIQVACLDAEADNENDDIMDGGSDSYWTQNGLGNVWQMPHPEDTVTLNEDFTQTEHFSNEAEDTAKLPLISREGLRKQKTSRRGGYQQNRVRKNNHQVDYLRRIYAETGGKLDRKQRKRIVK